MKHNLYVNKSIQHIALLLLILVLAFATLGASSSTAPVEQKSVSRIAISNYLEAQQNPNLSDEEKIKAVIDAYFTVRYEGQKLVEAQDFSALIEDDTLDWVKHEKDRREIELYIASLFDLGYQSYSFTLDYDSIEIKKNKAIVQLRQSHQVVYAAIAPEISELANLSHTITLHKKDGCWVIYKDEYEDEYTRLLATTKKDKIKQQIDENYRNWFANETGLASPSEFQDASMLSYGWEPILFKIRYGGNHENISTDLKSRALTATYPSSSVLALPSYSYNRSAARTFSYNNALVEQAPIPQAIINAYKTIYGTSWPITWPLKYRNEGASGDCTNFVSQAIFEGTGYTSGDANYFYPVPNDNNWYYKFSPTAQGSVTWVRVGWLYSFLLNTNTSKRGPYGTATGISCSSTSVSPGDPIFMKSGSSWAHAVIVYSIDSPCLNPYSIRVNSHNAYKRNEPLPTWGGFSWYGVKIQGYRK